MKKLLLPALFILFFSCKEENKSLTIKNEKLSKIIEDFVKSNNCEDCIHEMYIDKIDPHIYNILLYSGKVSLTYDENSNENQYSINSTYTKDGNEFKIYSGVEHYFKSNTKHKIDSLVNKGNDNKIWIVKDSFGTLKVEKREFAYPFMPLPKLLDKKNEDKFFKKTNKSGL